jgi:hypothetical protein
LTYILLYLVFKRVYQGDGVSADCVQKKKGLATMLLIQLGAGIYNHYFGRRGSAFMCWGGAPSCGGKDNGNEDSEYAKRRATLRSGYGRNWISCRRRVS